MVPLEYGRTIYNVFKMVNKKAKEGNNQKMGYISMLIYNYWMNIIKENKLCVEEIIKEEEIEEKEINLIPFFEYISANNIELYDFSKIDVTDVNLENKLDIERFVLTHIYYITQK